MRGIDFRELVACVNAITCPKESHTPDSRPQGEETEHLLWPCVVLCVPAGGVGAV